MIPKLFFCLPARRNLFLKTLTHFRSNFSILAVGNAPSQNLFLHFVTTRFNMCSADAAKMLKSMPSLGRLKTLNNAEKLVSTLNRHGFTEDQIVKIIRSRPSLIVTSAERFVEPNIQVLIDLGVERENVIKIVTGCPRILLAKPEVLRSSIAFWKDFGFRGIELTKFVLYKNFVLARSSLTPEQLDFIRKIGIHKESKTFKYVVCVVAITRIEVLKARIDNLQLCGLSPAETWELVRLFPQVLTNSEENIKKKMDNLQLCGFSPEEALQVVRAGPPVLNKSEENVKKKMNFMLNRMGLSLNFVTKHPRMFSMSLDKVMRPRFLVLQSMTTMNEAGEVPSRLHTMMMMTEAKFVAQIIQGHPESDALWTVYKNAIANVSKAQR